MDDEILIEKKRGTGWAAMEEYMLQTPVFVCIDVSKT